MNFFFGIAVGAIGMWAYQNGKLQGLMGGAPEPMRQAWQPAVDRVTQMASSDQVQKAVSTVQSTVQQHGGPEIVRPSAAEVAGRPSEPLPSTGA
jgi:hypothetical protein